MKFLLLLVAAVLISACGQEGTESNVDYLTDTSSQYTSGYCGQNIINDYNSVMIVCSALFSRSDIEECESDLLTLKARYPGINCLAEATGISGGEVMITEERINAILYEVQNL